MPDPTHNLRYSDDIERVPADEAESIAAIIASMTHESEVTTARNGHAVRASHAKSHGLMKGELRVFDGLPEPLLPPQDAYGAARQAYMDQAYMDQVYMGDVMAFRPSHALAAHRPLGSLMRARLATHPRLSAFRHGRNGTAEQEPRGPENIPD